MPLTSHTNFRIRGIPLNLERKDSVRHLVKKNLDLDSTTIINIHSLAVSPIDDTSRVATLSFSNIPKCFSDLSRNEWAFHLKDGEDLDLSSSLVFDTHFRGFTPFQRTNSDDCHVDIIAVTGLGGHALGSFKQKNGPFVWLRDGLPVDAPDLRILSYGYDTTIVNSSSFQNLTDLARSLQLDLEGIQDPSHPRPIVFIAHSLGGLLVKETLVQFTQDPFSSERSVLDLISGFMFFGVPHQGLAVECLVHMIRDSPNRALLESLSKNSPLLSRLQREFKKAISTRDCSIIAFYETERSSTAQEVQPGKWELSGPSEVLVEVSSATCGSIRQHPINRNHSEIVKFSSRQDELYRRVVLALKPLLADSRSLLMDGGTGAGHNPIIPRSEDEKSCLRSLSFPEQDHRYNHLRYDKNTCEWLLKDTQYQTWLNGPRGLFWIKGSPGTGKSVLMKFAVETMQRKHPADFVVAFFIHGRGVPLQRSPLGVYRALLSSLLGFFPDYLKDLTQRFNQKQERFGAYERKDGWVWTESELEEFLFKVLSQGINIHPVTIYVDALDECGEHDAKRLLQYFHDVMSIVDEEEGLLKICFSSRHYPILGLETMPTLLAEERNSEDIKLVVRNRLKSFNLHDKCHQIGDDILRKAQGGFQWAILTTDIIRNEFLRGLNSAYLREAVTTIPRDLQEIYRFILNGAEGEERAYMVNLFQWVLFSERPLSAHELREAITTSRDMEATATSQLRYHPNYSDTVSDFEIRVRHISRGLVEFQTREIWEKYQADGEDWDREAQFIHQSAADFVLREFLIEVDVGLGLQTVGGIAHFEISRSCLRYIVLQDILKTSDLSRSELSVNFPLLPYAVTFLLRHIKLAEDNNMAQTNLLECMKWHQQAELRRLSALWLKMDPDHSHAPMGWPFADATATHILVGFGSVSALQAYLTHHTVNFNARDSYGNTPLLLALRDNLEDLALLLIEHSMALQATDSSLGGEATQTEQPGEDVNLMSHVNTANSDGETPLGVAVSTKAHGVIQSLLKAGADPAAEKGLLFYAISNLDMVLLRDLIARKVCLNGAVFFAVQTLVASGQSDHETPIYEIISVLLKAGANTRRVPGVVKDFNLEYPDYEDDEYDDVEAIILATRQGLVSAVRLLIAHGVSPDVEDAEGDYPLLIAAENGRSDIVELLRHTDIDESTYPYISHDTAIVLLRSLYKDGIPSNILKECVRLNNFKLTQSILQSDNGIKITTDDWPEAVLWLALNNRYREGSLSSTTSSSRRQGRAEVAVERYEMVELLLRECDIDLTIQNDDGDTPLRWCLKRGMRDMVSLILSTGKVDIHKNDNNDNESPFWWTMRCGDNNVVELLLGLYQLHIHMKWKGRTAFWWLTEGRPYERGRIAIATAALYNKLFNCKTLKQD